MPKRGRRERYIAYTSYYYSRYPLRLGFLRTIFTSNSLRNNFADLTPLQIEVNGRIRVLKVNLVFSRNFLIKIPNLKIVENLKPANFFTRLITCIQYVPYNNQDKILFQRAPVRYAKKRTAPTEFLVKTSR